MSWCERRWMDAGGRRLNGDRQLAEATPEGNGPKDHQSYGPHFAVVGHLLWRCQWWSQCDRKHSELLSAENKSNCVYIRPPRSNWLMKPVERCVPLTPRSSLGRAHTCACTHTNTNARARKLFFVCKCRTAISPTLCSVLKVTENDPNPGWRDRGVSLDDVPVTKGKGSRRATAPSSTIKLSTSSLKIC